LYIVGILVIRINPESAEWYEKHIEFADIDYQIKLIFDKTTKLKDDGAEHFSEQGNAIRLVRLHGDDLRYVYPMKSWLVWDGIRWRIDDNGEMMRRAVNTIEKTFNEAALIDDADYRKSLRAFMLKSQNLKPLNAMITLAQSLCALSHDALDADPLLLGVCNGTINLRTGKFHEGRRDYYITKQCNVAYDPNATCPNWIAFQNKITLCDAALIAYKQRLYGLDLTALMVENIFIHHGGGSNGNTTELETIFDMLGDYAYATDSRILLSLDNKGGDNATPTIAALKGKRIMHINETNKNDRLSGSRMKYLAGSETMSGTKT
jgi:putative DNA primase/helicase